MAELLIVLVVCVGLYRRRGRWEWSRRSLAHAVDGVVERGGHMLDEGRRGLPGILAQLIEDLRSFGDDALGLLHPSARRRIEHRARALVARGRSMSTGGSRLAAAGQGGSGALESLQRSYLDGSISLERYVQEAERLNTPA